MLRVLTYIAVLFAAVGSAKAVEPRVVMLWPDKTPGDVGIDRPERTWMYDSAILKESTKLVTDVSQPSITIYSPERNNTGTAVIICPGGGYHNLFWDLEGVEVAEWLNSHGITGIILKYRCPRRLGDIKGEPPLGPLLDAQRAVSLVRSRAKEWNIDPTRIGMVGFSAGGHLSLATATRFEKRTYDRIDAVDDVSCRPDFALLCYSGYLKSKEADTTSAGISVPSGTPPIFLAHTTDDSISTVEHSVFMYLALKRASIPVEMHIFASGEHDFGVRQNGKLPESWTGLSLKWLRSQELLSEEGSK